VALNIAAGVFIHIFRLFFLHFPKTLEGHFDKQKVHMPT